MREAGTKGTREQGAVAAMCRVEGCGALAAMGRAYCLKCESEIDALARWDARQDELRAAAETTARFERLARHGRIALDVVNVAVVVGGLLYLGLVFSVRLLQWLGWW